MIRITFTYSHISIKLLVVLVAYIYIKLANYIDPYFHSTSISIFSLHAYLMTRLPLITLGTHSS